MFRKKESELLDKKGYVANLSLNMNEEIVPVHICKFGECKEKGIKALEDKKRIMLQTSCKSTFWVGIIEPPIKMYERLTKSTLKILHKNRYIKC
jgi:hypothetical protein